MGLFGWLLGSRAGDDGRVKEALSRGARIVDVRTPEEFRAGHVEGAINVPIQGIVTRLDELEPRDAPIVLYCRSGARSARAASLLRTAGFVDVIDAGAMSAWPS